MTDKAPQSRRDHWKENPWYFGPICRVEKDEDPLQSAWQERVENPKRPRKSTEFSTGELTRMSKEVIFHRDEEGNPTFTYIVFSLDFGSAEMTVESSFMISEPDHEELITTIGLAYAYSVPVVPDTPDLAPELEALEREFLTDGVKVSAHEGRLMPGHYVGVDLDSIDALQALDDAKPIQPSEVRVLLKTVERELSVLAEAQRTLDSLRGAIEELEAKLEGTDTVEHDLQRTLTRHPILFGPEYVKMVPKFRLGGDFEMDFALQRSSGLIDLVEIEGSKHPLFTKKGDPRAQLIHAEQQVIDWFDWIDQHGDLARRRLPEMQRPVGMVVIGRDCLLGEGDAERLQRRNQILAPSVEVMTFDGLLMRARGLMSHFESLRDAAPAG